MKQAWERNKEELDSLLESYPWFTSARRARALLTGENDPALTLPAMFWPTIPPLNSRQNGLKAPPKPVSPTVPTEDELIARFLSHGNYRIVPDEGAYVAETLPEERFEDTDGDLAMEELAEIYRAQGLAREAKELSRK